MAIEFVQGTGGSPSSSLVFPSAATSGNLLIAATVGYDGSTYPILPTVTDNLGGSWVCAAYAGDIPAGTISIWYRLSADVGITTVLFGGPDFYACWIAEFSGGDFNADGANGASYSSNTVYTAPTLNTSGADVVIAASVLEQAGGFSAGEPYTDIPSTNTGGCAAGYQIQTAAGSAAASFTQAPAGNAGAVIAAFTIGGAVVPSPLLTLLGVG